MLRYGLAMLAAAALAVPSLQAAGTVRPGEPPLGAVAFDRFVQASGPVCQRQASERCVDIGWRFADLDRDNRLSLDEARSVRTALADWMAWRRDSLGPNERASIALGTLIVDSAGLDRLFASYDANGDGRLTRAEFLADVRLDQRPLGRVLADPAAVDRKAVGRRLGPMGPLLLEGMLR